MKIRAIAAHFIETAPLLAFLIFAEHIERSVARAWLGPYLVGSVLAALTMGCLWRWRQPMNRLLLGINVYFLSGALGLLLHFSWLNQLYGVLQAAGMLLCMLVVGAIVAVCSSAGLLGVDSAPRRAVNIASWLLWLACLAAFALSWQMQGQRLWAEFVPFVSVFFLQRLLQAWLLRQPPRAPINA